MVEWRRMACAVAGYVIVGGVMGSVLAFVEPVAVSGGSMRPALSSGDLAIVRRSASAAEGDIVLLRREGHSAVLHRVVRVKPGGALVTRGDANPIADLDAASPADVAGVVVASIPIGKAIDRWRTRDNRATLSAQSHSVRR